jgi:hypothetical protein
VLAPLGTRDVACGGRIAEQELPGRRVAGHELEVRGEGGPESLLRVGVDVDRGGDRGDQLLRRPGEHLGVQRVLVGEVVVDDRLRGSRGAGDVTQAGIAMAAPAELLDCRRDDQLSPLLGTQSPSLGLGCHVCGILPTHGSVTVVRYRPVSR